MLEEHSFMSEYTVRVTVLGTRGSLPVSGKQTDDYGGATSAYMMEASGERLFIDGGTGILNAPKEPVSANDGSQPVRILITHTHIDHILGLPVFLLTQCAGRDVEFYGRSRSGETLEQQLYHLFHPPLWPAELKNYPMKSITFHEVKERFQLGAFEIRVMESSHPGGSLIYRVDAAGKSVVFATDFEHGDGREEELAAFAEGSNLLLYDGQYSETSEPSYESRKGFGHSTEEMGLKVLQSCGAKVLRIIHHDPISTDDMLAFREARFIGKALAADGPGQCAPVNRAPDIAFAREGETVEL